MFFLRLREVLGMSSMDDQATNVLVAYEPSNQGSAALAYALELARATGATLTIASITPQEREDVGCARCRASARAWNEQMRHVAHEWLSEVAGTIGSVPDVRYLAACGPERDVIAAAARQRDADVVVLPRQRLERLRQLLHMSRREDLSRRGHWRVLTPPHR